MNFDFNKDKLSIEQVQIKRERDADRQKDKNKNRQTEKLAIKNTRRQIGMTDKKTEGQETGKKTLT